jgi:hypothetical protein
MLLTYDTFILAIYHSVSNIMTVETYILRTHICKKKFILLQYSFGALCTLHQAV